MTIKCFQMIESINTMILEEIKNELLSELRQLMHSMAQQKRQEWLCEKDTRAFLGVSRGTLYKYRKVGVLPFTKFQRKIYYRKVDLEQFLENNFSGQIKKGRRYEKECHHI